MSGVGTGTGKAVATVLVVEDEVLVRAAAVAYLQDRGFSVLEASSGDQAQSLMRHTPDIGVVFSDVQMPGSLDGVALAQWVATECPWVRVLLTSGRSVPEQSLAWRFIAKPYTLAELEQQLVDLIASRPES
jgi:two-component system, response regulator PdtaR